MKRVKNLIVALVLTTAIALGTVIAYFSFSGNQRRYLFRQEKEFYLVEATMGGNSIASFLDAKKSKMVFDTDGNAALYIVPDKTIMTIANAGLALMLGNSGLDLASEEVGAFLGTYVSNGLFPGFDLTEFIYSLDLLKSIGISIGGVDWEEEPYATLVKSVEEDLVVPAGLTLPSTIYLKLEGKYYITEEGEYTAIHFQLNDVSENGEPFLIMTYSKDGGVESVYTKIEFVKVEISVATK